MIRIVLLFLCLALVAVPRSATAVCGPNNEITAEIVSVSPTDIANNTATQVAVRIKNTCSTTEFWLEVVSASGGYSVTPTTTPRQTIATNQTRTFNLSVNPGGRTGDFTITFRVRAMNLFNNPSTVKTETVSMRSMAAPGTFEINQPATDYETINGDYTISWTWANAAVDYDLTVSEVGSNGQPINPPVVAQNDLTTANYRLSYALLKQNTSYQIKVVAVNPVGTRTAPIRTFITPPYPGLGAFGLLAPTADQLLGPSPSFSWQPCENATSYNLNLLPEVNGNPGTTPLRVVTGLTGTGYTWADPPLERGKKYYVSVLANGGGGQSRINSQGLVPFQVEGLGSFILGLPNPDQQNVTRNTLFTWTPSEGATSYRFYLLFRDESYDYRLRAFYDVAPQFVVVQFRLPEDIVLLPGEEYIWIVEARNGSAARFNDGGGRVFTASPLAPFLITYPTLGTADAPKTPKITWNPSPGNPSYRVEIAETDETGAPILSSVRNSPLLSATEWTTNFELVPGKSYAVRVRAQDAFNTIYNYGGWQPFRATPFTTGITLVSPANEATGIPFQPTLTWSPVSGAAGYRVVLWNKGLTSDGPPMVELPAIELGPDATAVNLADHGIRLNGLAFYIWTVEAVNGPVKLTAEPRTFRAAGRAANSFTDQDMLDQLLGRQVFSPADLAVTRHQAPLDASDLVP